MPSDTHWISEYGASLWADPQLWIPEAARLLRPRGRLVFLTNSVLAYLCSPGTEYHLSHGDWIRVLRANGSGIEDLIEIQAPPDAVIHGYYDDVTADWARRWPAEEIWVARKRG